MFTRLYATTATSGLRSLSTKGPISSFMWVCSQDHEWQFSSLHLTISSDPAFSLRTDQGRRSQACEHLNLFNHAISSSLRRCRVPARASRVSGLAFSTTENVLGASRGAVRILLVPLLHRNVNCLTSRGRILRQRTQNPGKQEWIFIYSTFAGFRSGSQGRRLSR